MRTSLLSLLLLGMCFTFPARSVAQSCSPFTVQSSFCCGEYYVGDSIKIQLSVYAPDGGTAPFTFSAINIPANATFSSTGLLKMRAIDPHYFHFDVKITDAVGCTDTYGQDVTVMCDPLNNLYVTWNGLQKGQYFEQAVPGFSATTGPFTGFVNYDSSLPAGLTLTADGKIKGTPTVYGNFVDIPIAYTGLSGCNYKTNITFNISNSAPVKTLYLTSVCAQGDSIRNWKVFNQNNFDVNVNWNTVYTNVYSGSFIAKPGDNFFASPNVGGPNTVKIQWLDQNGVLKSLVQPSSNMLCNPPACVSVSSVDFYHQGLQKDGQHVASALSDVHAIVGQPDANDAAGNGSKAFSLGYDGFVILQLNANLVDGAGSDLTVFEFSDGNPSFASYPERAEVFASMNGTTWVSLGVTSPGTACTQSLDTDFDLAGKLAWCRYIKILDITDRHAKILNASTCTATSTVAFNDASNGFDVDAVTCKMSGMLAGRQDEGISPAIKFTSESIIYPNPTSGAFVIDLSREQEFVLPEDGAVDVQILDMTGASFYKRQHTLDDAWKTQCDVSHLAAGVFIARVNAGRFSRYYKFIKY